MAKITTEKGRCAEYVFFGHNAGLHLILQLTDLYSSSVFREPENDPIKFSEHTVRIYKDTVDICKNHLFRKNFTEYKKDDIESMTKGFRIYLIPVIILTLFIAFSVAVKFPELLVFAPIIIPFCFGRCIKIKIKGRILPIRLTYSPSRYGTMIDKILLTWKAKV